MHGRRTHARCVIPASAEGILSVSRDVQVEAVDAARVTVISREPGVPGERGHLTPTGANSASIPVRVSASRLAIIGGSVRHVLDLAVLLSHAPDAS